jgi:hypothetical protein
MWAGLLSRVTSTNGNGKKPLTLRDIVYVALISFLTPFAAKYGLTVGDSFDNNNDPLPIVEQQTPKDQVSMIFDLATKLTELSQPQPTPIDAKENAEVEMWLDSPVTQRYTYNYDKEYWSTSKEFKDSFKSPPSIRLGLRSDGTVVWKKVTPGEK